MADRSFLARLTVPGAARIDLRDVKAAYRASHPEFAELGDFEGRLLAALRELEAKGGASLPKGRTGWDRGVVPAMPRWVAVTRPATLKPVRPAVPWVPELSFAAQCLPETRRTLEAINEWLLANRPMDRPMVPTAERSLEIFGDEKRLNELFKGNPRSDGQPTMFNGKLRLDALRAREVEPPLHHVRGRRGLPVLVVENLASYDTFVRWNVEGSSMFGAIAWGAGGNFEKSWTHLRAVAEAAGTTTVLYLGDVDAPGLAILGRVAGHAEREGAFRLLPHAGFYRHLCTQGRRVNRIADAGALAMARAVLARHFPPDIAAEALVVLFAGQAVPQESLGIEALREGLWSRVVQDADRKRYDGDGAGFELTIGTDADPEIMLPGW